jgi:hypothetical protein
MHARWDQESQSHQSAPEYVSTSIGRVEIGNISNRLRDIAALLAAHGLDEAAEHLAMACGALLAQGTPAGGRPGRNGSNGSNGVNGNGNGKAVSGSNGAPSH